MHFIDRYAYTNRIRNVDPACKVALALVVLLLCLVLNRPSVGLLATAWMWVLAVGVAGLPAGDFSRLLAAEAFFLVLMTAGVALSFSIAVPPPGTTWMWQVGPLWVASSPASLTMALHPVTRALGGAAALNFLAMTTPLVDLIDLLRRLRVPAWLIDLIAAMYRFIFVLLDSLERMVTAQDSRLGYRSFRRGMSSAGMLTSGLFVNALQRTRRLQTALEARGYDGELRVLPSIYRQDWALWGTGLATVATLILAWSVS